MTPLARALATSSAIASALAEADVKPTSLAIREVAAGVEVLAQTWREPPPAPRIPRLKPRVIASAVR